MTSPEPVPPQAVEAAEATLRAYLEPWLTAEAHGTSLDSQIHAAAAIALRDAAPHLAAAGPYKFAALLDAINAIAAKVDLPLDLAANLMRAIASYGDDRKAAERERCVRIAASYLDGNVFREFADEVGVDLRREAP